jgi:hypothetical protein
MPNNSAQFLLFLQIYNERVNKLKSTNLCSLKSPADHAAIRVFDEAGNVIETQEHAGEFKEP